MYRSLEEFCHQTWSFHHWPEFYAQGVYERVEAAWVECCKIIPDLLSIWKVGHVGVPGISDLDLILVFKDQTAKPDPLIWSIQSLASPGPYIALHEPLIFSEPIFDKLPFWQIGSFPEKLWGDGALPYKVDDRDARLLGIIALMDGCIQLQPRMLLGMFLSGSIHVRAALCQINAIGHMLKLFKQATTTTTTPWDAFTEDFMEYRQNWFSLTAAEQKQLPYYIAESLTIAYELMAELLEYLADNNFFRTSSSRSCVLYTAVSRQTVFLLDWKPETALTYTLQRKSKPHNLVLFLPLAFVLPVIVHREINGVLSSFVRKFSSVRSVCPGYWDPRLLQLAVEHARTHNEHIQFLLSNGFLTYNANFHGMGLNAPYLLDMPYRRFLRQIYYLLLSVQSRVKLCAFLKGVK